MSRCHHTSSHLANWWLMGSSSLSGHNPHFDIDSFRNLGKFLRQIRNNYEKVLRNIPNLLNQHPSLSWEMSRITLSYYYYYCLDTDAETILKRNLSLCNLYSEARASCWNFAENKDVNSTIIYVELHNLWRTLKHHMKHQFDVLMTTVGRSDLTKNKQEKN